MTDSVLNSIEFFGKYINPNLVSNTKLRHVIIRSVRLLKYDSHWDGQYVEYDRSGYTEYSEYGDHSKYSEDVRYAESVEDY